MIDPFQRAQHRGQQFDEKILVVEPIHHLDGADEKERRAIDGAVVGRVWDQLEVGQLPVAEFVQDFARFLLAAGIDAPSLLLSQVTQGASCDLWIDHEGLDRRDQCITTERGREPRNAGHRKQAGVVLLEQDSKIHLAAT